MAIQVKKTYRDINPEMLCDEIRGLLQKQGVVVVETETQTYGLPSGDTQTCITMVFKMQDEKECGDAQIISSPGGETKLLIDLNDNLLLKENISRFQEDIDFVLDSYEIKW